MPAQALRLRSTISLERLKAETRTSGSGFSASSGNWFSTTAMRRSLSFRAAANARPTIPPPIITTSTLCIILLPINGSLCRECGAITELSITANYPSPLDQGYAPFASLTSHSRKCVLIL
ncbi:Uncharacterised protein [Vibrio cholerae]|nr:Uncharacterised protein [Vibrio cholerae]CSB36940.1 Uncharacterised protein [Vibrio cholerae]CSI37705.1 Uncharacterised protein [Vibrio cholerae]